MNKDELADELRAMWEAAPEGARSPMVHLFGIKYADELEGMNLKDIAELAGRPRSMGTEIYKGSRLAQYVTVKKAASGESTDSAFVVEEPSELRSELDEFKQGTKDILKEILALLNRADVLRENYPPASMALSDLRRKIREL